MKGMVTCKVCGRDFPLIFEEHKVVRDSGKKANLMGALTLHDEEALWDAFDCPHCGCQNVMQIRKMIYLGEEEKEIDTQTEHDGCCGCKYKDRMEYEDPCVRCKHGYVDRWEAEDDE